MEPASKTKGSPVFISVAVFSSQRSPTIRQGLIVRASDCNGSRSRGITIDVIKSHTILNSGQYPFLSASCLIRSCICFWYNTAHESSHSTTWGSVATQVVMGKPNFPVGDTEFLCSSARRAVNVIGSGGCSPISRNSVRRKYVSISAKANRQHTSKQRHPLVTIAIYWQSSKQLVMKRQRIDDQGRKYFQTWLAKMTPCVRLGSKRWRYRANRHQAFEFAL